MSFKGFATAFLEGMTKNITERRAEAKEERKRKERIAETLGLKTYQKRQANYQKYMNIANKLSKLGEDTDETKQNIAKLVTNPELLLAADTFVTNFSRKYPNVKITPQRINGLIGNLDLVGADEGMSYEEAAKKAAGLVVQNIKHTNNTQSIAVDTSGNVTASGNVTTTGNTSVGGTLAVTGVHTVGNNAVHTSDGGAVTQNLVQGLAKHWIQINGESTVAIQDSFNNSSVSDNSTGYYSFHIANDMANDDYSALETTNRVSGGSGVLMHHHIGGTGTDQYTVYNSNSSGTLTDTSQVFGAAFGDLA